MTDASRESASAVGTRGSVPGARRGVPGTRRGAFGALPPAPHVRIGSSSAGDVWLVSACLLPAAGWGVFLFGIPALLVIAVSVVAALAAEAVTSPLLRRFTLHDGSAFLTGLIIGLSMPAGVPLYVPAAASAFAIVVVKQSFGGLGCNWMNPARGGVVFALLSWGDSMTRWLPARGTESALPPFVAWRAALDAHTGAGGPLAVLSAAGYSFSPLDDAVVGWVNAHLLAPLGAALHPGSFDLLVGHASGLIGALSVPLLLLGALILLKRRFARWQVPVAYVASFAVLTFLLGGPVTGQRWLAGGLVFHLLGGGLVLGAFYVAIDPVTSPLTGRGRWIYGVVLGVLTFVTRFFGSLGDGVAVAILLGNCAVPLIDRVSQRRVVNAGRGKTI
ncbi:MAG TPA: RnfABCDGE type electron transport complex subunit D [Spirochaetia bacterium]